MATPKSAGIVAELWRFPVKSMAGERLDEAVVTSQGILGDRGYALLDAETDQLVSASNRHFPGLLNWRAAYLEPPRPGAALPPVRLTRPDGTSATSDSRDLTAFLSAHFERSVTLVRAKPRSYAEQQAAFFAGVGLANSAPAEALVDFCPVSVISTATMTHLGRARTGSVFDPRRFRMNIAVTTSEDGLVENAWVGRELTIGREARFAIIMPDPRCAIATLSQGDLPKDPGILRTVAEMNSIPVGTGGPLPCAGVYATVANPGAVRRADRVCLGAVTSGSRTASSSNR